MICALSLILEVFFSFIFSVPFLSSIWINGFHFGSSLFFLYKASLFPYLSSLLCFLSDFTAALSSGFPTLYYILTCAFFLEFSVFSLWSLCFSQEPQQVLKMLACEKSVSPNIHFQTT